VNLLAKHIESGGRNVKIIKFPDRTTLVGKTIDDYLRGKNRPNDNVIHLLFSTNRWELEDYILKLLGQGTFVILDRYAYSGVAYSSAKGLSINWCKNCDKGLPKPDIVFYLQITENEVEKREEFGDEIYELREF